jgi:hypothetical protein
MIGGHFIGVEAAPVIAYAHGYLAVQTVDIDDHLAGPGVLDDIIKRFLGDAVESYLNIWRQVAVAFDLEFQGNARAPAKGVRQVPEQLPDIGFHQRGWAQLEQQRAHLSQGAAVKLAQLFQAAFAFLGAAFPDARQHVRDQGGREQGLRNGVVQLARQPVALTGYCNLAGLVAQPGRFERQRGLVGDANCQANFLGAECPLMVIEQGQRP